MLPVSPAIYPDPLSTEYFTYGNKGYKNANFSEASGAKVHLGVQPIWLKLGRDLDFAKVLAPCNVKHHIP